VKVQPQRAHTRQQDLVHQHRAGQERDRDYREARWALIALHVKSILYYSADRITRDF
jgi:hypothetical protein